MRIIAGEWRSRRLVFPPSDVTRPMPDRVREAVFSMLGAHYGTPGVLPPLHVADVFAGSGSLGLEALSRGAADGVFFERDRRALTALRTNLESLNVGRRATVVTRDAWIAAALPRLENPFDLVFLDPPYQDSQDGGSAGPVCTFLEAFTSYAAESALVMLHHHVRTVYPGDPESRWRKLDQRTYGSSTVTLWTR